jgi:hypothetical protein
MPQPDHPSENLTRLRIRLPQGYGGGAVLEIEGIAARDGADRAAVAALDALYRTVRIMAYFFAFACFIAFIAKYHSFHQRCACLD